MRFLLAIAEVNLKQCMMHSLSAHLNALSLTCCQNLGACRKQADTLYEPVSIIELDLPPCSAAVNG